MSTKALKNYYKDHWFGVASDAKLTPWMRPVLISGPLVSRAMPIGLYWILPGSKLSHASRTFLMVSAWYYRQEKKCNMLTYLKKRNHILAEALLLQLWFYQARQGN